MQKKKVLIVDDSALIRSMLKNMINKDERFEVCGAAEDPYVAREMIKQLNPDILTLDIEMPRMNGITFLKNLMRLRPMPVVMISTLTHAGAPETLEALAIGAVDFIGKPKQHSDLGLAHYQQEIISKLAAAAGANMHAYDQVGEANETKTTSALGALVKGKRRKPEYIIAIGSSTGGTEAVKAILSKLPSHCPPIVVAQHIPPMFSASFARRLNGACELDVFEATDNQTIEAGCVYIAPGGKHLKVARAGSKYICKLEDGPPVNHHKPSVEVLFDSVTQSCGGNSLGLMLTGMGADGAQSMLRMKQAGAHTIVQDEASSVVWGMPGAVVKINGHSEQVSLPDIAKSVLSQAFK